MNPTIWYTIILIFKFQDRINIKIEFLKNQVNLNSQQGIKTYYKLQEINNEP